MHSAEASSLVNVPLSHAAAHKQQSMRYMSRGRSTGWRTESAAGKCLTGACTTGKLGIILEKSRSTLPDKKASTIA